MPHIHTGPGQIDHTVTMYVFNTSGDEPRCLVHKHKKFGKLMPVGGHIELDETPWGAAEHELLEEAGLSLEDMEVLQPKERLKVFPGAVLHPQPVCMNTHDISKDHFHSDTAYALITKSLTGQQLAEGESTDLRWLTRGEIAKLTSAETFENSRAVFLYIFDVLLHEWEPVPATEFSTKKFCE